MAKINFGGVVQDARGKQNGIIYSKNRFGAYVKRKVTPTNPRTTAQTAIRSSFTDQSKAWGGSLSESDRTNWTTFAGLWPRTDVFGNAIKISGQNMFISLNSRLIQAGVATLTSPPADLVAAPIPINDTSLSIAKAMSLFTFDQSAVSPLSDQVFYLFATGNLPPGRQPTKSDYRFIAVVTPATTGFPASTDIFSAWTAVFGALTVGAKIGVLVATLNTINGALVPGIQLVSIVAA